MIVLELNLINLIFKLYQWHRKILAVSLKFDKSLSGKVLA